MANGVIVPDTSHPDRAVRRAAQEQARREKSKGDEGLLLLGLLGLGGGAAWLLLHKGACPAGYVRHTDGFCYPAPATCPPGQHLDASGHCVPDSTGQTWASWWAAASSGHRQAVAIFWDLIVSPPFGDGVQMTLPATGDPFPCNVWDQGDCGGPFDTVGWRIITDRAWQFFNQIDRAAGGSAQQCPPFAGEDASVCNGCACSYFGTCTQQHWLGVAGTQILGRPWTTTITWGPGLHSFCNQMVGGWEWEVFINLIQSEEFAARVAEQAAAAAPPWMAGGHPGPA